ncbi:MAG: hypothetical protein JNL98_10775 [Bryobacterales bacterium]|nr:hypothetical protein [Bryobacterales bacterium]
MYVYNANAYAIGGNLRRPLQDVINVPAASSLSWVGGFQSAESGPFRLGNILSFSRAYTQVSGSFDERDGERVYNAQATAVIEDLRVQEVVSAKRVVAQIASRVPWLDNPNAPELLETEFSFAGTHFEGLHINGRSVEVDFNTDLWNDCRTLSALRQRYRVDAQFRGEMNLVNSWKEHADKAPESLRAGLAWTKGLCEEDIPERHGTILTTLLRRPIRAYCGNTEGLCTVIPDFGKIYIAELIVDGRSRRLNMLRFELGSPDEGNFAAGGVGGNGSWYP